MHKVDAVAPHAYADPWHQSLASRLRQLTTGRFRVAYFYEKPDNSTFRYRVYNMAQTLSAHGDGEVSASYFFLNDLHALDQIVAAADQLVICRSRYDDAVAHLIRAFRIRGKRVLYDTDDLVFNPQYAHLLMSTLDVDTSNPAEWDHWYAYTGRLGAVLRLCDGAITTNDYLAAQITEFAHVPVQIVPNFMNAEQLTYSAALRQAKEKSRAGADGLLHFGYFSGSPSHNRDLGIVVPALEALLDERDDVGVVVVGYIEIPPALRRFGARVVRWDFTDYVNLQRYIARVEFNLMPLQFNVFTNCKSELKYFEAAAVGTLSVASPTHTYARAIRHGTNGYIAKAHEWHDVLRACLNELAQYEEHIGVARTHALEAYCPAAQLANIQRALTAPMS